MENRALVAVFSLHYNLSSAMKPNVCMGIESGINFTVKLISDSSLTTGDTPAGKPGKVNFGGIRIGTLKITRKALP